MTALAAPPGSPGLRERKKQQTRLAISQVATRMFIERGFDHVTLAEVAEAANVSVNTVFNYFSTKEELFFDRADEVAEAASQVVRERRAGESAIDALHRRFREMLSSKQGQLLTQRVAPFLAAIEASPALQAHERVMLDDCERRLARTLAKETGVKEDHPTPRVVATMVTALIAMLVREFRGRVLRGDSDKVTRAALLRLGERGFVFLHAGASDYGVRT
jgi:AcrR family transcriptional regulator